MKKNLLFLLFLLPAFANAQINPFGFTKQQVDSLNQVAKQTENDSLKIGIYQNLSLHYMEKNRDSSIYYAEKQLVVAKKLKQPIWQGFALTFISYGWLHLGNYSKSFQAANDALKLAEDNTSEINFFPINNSSPFSHLNRLALLSLVYQKLSFLHSKTGNGDKAIAYLLT